MKTWRGAMWSVSRAHLYGTSRRCVYTTYVARWPRAAKEARQAGTKHLGRRTQLRFGAILGHRSMRRQASVSGKACPSMFSGTSSPGESLQGMCHETTSWWFHGSCWQSSATCSRSTRCGRRVTSASQTTRAAPCSHTEFDVMRLELDQIHVISTIWPKIGWAFQTQREDHMMELKRLRIGLSGAESKLCALTRGACWAMDTQCRLADLACADSEHLVQRLFSSAGRNAEEMSNRDICGCRDTWRRDAFLH